MSDQIPLPAKTDYGLPPLPINGAALARFTIEMATRLDEFEKRFAEPRQHPRMVFAHSRRLTPATLITGHANT